MDYVSDTKEVTTTPTLTSDTTSTFSSIADLPGVTLPFNTSSAAFNLVNPKNMTERTYIVETEDNGTFYVTGPNSNTFDPKQYVNKVIAGDNDTANSNFSSAALSGVNPQNFSQRVWLDEDENGNKVSVLGSNFSNSTTSNNSSSAPYAPSYNSNSLQLPIYSKIDEEYKQMIEEKDTRNNSVVTVSDFKSYISKTESVPPSEIENCDSFLDVYNVAQQYDVFGTLNKRFSNSINNLTSENGKIGAAWGDIDTEFNSIFSKCENLFNVNGLGIESALEPLKESYSKAKTSVDDFLADVAAEYANVTAKKEEILAARAAASKGTTTTPPTTS